MNKQYKKSKITYLLVSLVFLFNVLFSFSSVKAAYSADTLVAMTNSARASSGLGSLSSNSKLASAAYAKASDMLTDGYFAHNSPDGQTPWDFIKGTGYNYTYAGENLAIGYTDATELFNAWMNSPTHRDNILNSNYREIGIAVVSGEYQGTEALVVVQEFGAPAEAVSGEISSASPTATPSAESASQANQNFSLVKEKSEFDPKSIFAGEEVSFTVTVKGNVQTLEAQIFDEKIDLLSSSSIKTDGEEKTYSLTQKVNQVGISEVKVLAADQKGNQEIISLGDLTVNQSVITKGSTQEAQGFWAKLTSNRWSLFGLILLGVILIGSLLWFISRKIKFNRFAPLPWHF